MQYVIQPQTRPLIGIKPIVLDGEVGYFVRRDRLILMRLTDLHAIDSIGLPLPKMSGYLTRSQLLTRALRLGVQCGSVWRDTVVIAAGGRLISVRKTGDTLSEARLEAHLRQGRSPLNFAVLDGVDGFDDGVCYGEYFTNPARGPVGIMRRDQHGQWSRAFEFPAGEINHIHNLVPDPARGCVWILTGDFDEGAAIWMARNNFSTVEAVVRGTQEVRACVAYPVPQGLLYATDSQLHGNSIRLLEAGGAGWTHRQLWPVNGPVIYGARVGELYVFSTATEPNQAVRCRLSSLLDTRPGPGIARNESQVILGSIEHGFHTVLTRAKDPLPYRLFQFGNIFFPSGTSSNDRLFIYSIANRGVGMSTEVFKLNVKTQLNQLIL